MSFAPAAVVARRAALLKANLGVLGQKLDLLRALDEHKAKKDFSRVCAVVGASVGQHLRHSNDHLEKVAELLKASSEDELHYDVRVRGNDDETNMDAAEERIRCLSDVYQQEMEKLMILSPPSATASTTSSSTTIMDDAAAAAAATDDNNNKKSSEDGMVLACFLLSGDASEGEFSLPSTIDRELGFVAHHAIHHLAMVKIITVGTLRLLPPGGLPEGFGTAPSTIVFENREESSAPQQQQQQQQQS